MPHSPSAASSGLAAERAEHPLGVARRARRVVHDVADGPVGRIGGGLRVAHAGVGAEAGEVAHAEADRRRQLGLLGGVERHVGEALVGHEGLGPRVLEDVRHLGRHQVVVDGHQAPAGLEARQVELEHLHAVGQEGGDHVPGLQVQAPQSVHDLVGPAQQLACGVLGAVRRHQRQMVRILVGQRPETEIAHASIPRVLVAVSASAAVPGRPPGSPPRRSGAGGRRVPGAGWRRPGGDARTGSSRRSTARDRRPRPGGWGPERPPSDPPARA